MADFSEHDVVFLGIKVSEPVPNARSFITRIYFVTNEGVDGEVKFFSDTAFRSVLTTGDVVDPQDIDLVDESNKIALDSLLCSIKENGNEYTPRHGSFDIALSVKNGRVIGPFSRNDYPKTEAQIASTIRERRMDNQDA